MGRTAPGSEREGSAGMFKERKGVLAPEKDGFGREAAGEEAEGELEGVPMPGLPPHG